MSDPQTSVSESRDAIQMIPVTEVAKILGVSTRSVWRLVSSQKIIPPLKVGGAARWRYDELRRWIDAGCPTPPPSIARKPK
jgi:excisionase family DNA binding protein